MEETLEQALARWREAELLTAEQVSDIRDWEDTHPADAPPPSLPTEETTSRGGSSVVAEGLAYVGAALALGAGFSVFARLWEDFGATARISLLAIGTVLLGAGAYALRNRVEGSLHRLATVLAALTVVGVAGTLAVTLAELTSIEEGTIAMAAGLAGLAVGVPIHLVRESWPTTLVTGAALLTAVFGAESLFDMFDSALPAGITLVTIGLAWAAAGWSGMARPQSAFEVTGLLTGGVGVQVLAFEDLTLIALIIGLLVAAGAMAVGLSEDRTAPAVLGGLGITVYAPQLVFDLFGETVGGPLALFVGGISLVTVAVTILRRRDVV